MYGVKDTFERTVNYSAPELTQAMKAKRNVRIILTLVAVALVGGLFWVFTTVAWEFIWPGLLAVGITAFVVFMAVCGLDYLFAGFSWLFDQFVIVRDAKKLGVRDE